MKAYVVKAKEVKREEKENGVVAGSGGPLAPRIKQELNKEEIVKKAVQTGIAEEQLADELAR